MNIIGFFVLLHHLKCHKTMKKPIVLVTKSLKFQAQMKAEWDLVVLHHRDLCSSVLHGDRMRDIQFKV